MFEFNSASVTIATISITVTLAAVCVLVVVLHAVAVRLAELQPATVNPFRPAAPEMSDTMNSSMVQTPMSMNTEWSTAMVSNLHEAEQMLDRLESHGFSEREIMIFGQSSFAVRWK